MGPSLEETAWGSRLRSRERRKSLTHREELFAEREGRVRRRKEEHERTETTIGGLQAPGLELRAWLIVLGEVANFLPGHDLSPLTMTPYIRPSPSCPFPRLTPPHISRRPRPPAFSPIQPTSTRPCTPFYAYSVIPRRPVSS